MTTSTTTTTSITFLQEVLRMKKQGISMNDIAVRLGFYDSSAIYKRMKKIEKAIKNDVFEGDEEKELSSLLKGIKADSPLKGASKFLVTTAISDTPTNKSFLRALQKYADEIDAKLIVLPIYYKNISLFVKRNEEDMKFASDIMPYIYDRREQINENLMILGDFPISATAKNPLTGLETVTGDSSGIFAHTTIAMNSVATPSSKLPKLLYTTGTVSMPNYSATKTGKLAEHHHNSGALIVEVESKKIFHVRQLEWNDKTQDFYDLEHRVTPKGVEKNDTISALVMGDLHIEYISQDVVNATFGKKGILSKLNCENLVLHDALDMYSASHHHNRSPSLKFKKRTKGQDVVIDELQRLIEFHNEHVAKYAKTGNVLYVDSNHNRHLDQWLDDPHGATDIVNGKTYHYLNYLKYSEIERTGDVPDTLQLFMKDKVKNMDNIHFVDSRQGYRIHDIDVSLHGDIGTNGSRGSRQQYTKIGCDVIVGHSHSPGITLNSWQVGTSSELELEYNAGPSSWLNTHCVVYPNGKRSLINIIDGKWRK